MKRKEILYNYFFLGGGGVLIDFGTWFILLQVFPSSRVSLWKLSSKSSREDMCRLHTSFLLNIQSRVKQKVDMTQIQNCVTRYSLCAKYQEGGLWGSREKCDRIFLWRRRRRRKTTDSDPYMSPPLKRSGDTKRQSNNYKIVYLYFL